MLIYRIEHRDEPRGPYTGRYAIYEIADAHNDYLHPSVCEDFTEVYEFAKTHSDYIHGMPTKESLLEWFEGYLLRLHYEDFVLKTFEVEEPYYASGMQSIFDPKHAVVVDTEELIDYHDLKEKEKV